MSTKKLRNYLFFSAYSIFLIYSFLGHIDTFNAILKIFTVVAVAVLILCFFMSKHTKKEFIILLLFLILSLVSSINSKDYGFVKLAVFLMAMKNINFRSLICFENKIRILLILTTMCLYYVGIAPDVVSAMPDGSIVHSFGFTNPNVLGFSIFVWLLEILYLSHFKITLKNGIVFIISFLFVTYVINCRTISVMTIFVLFISLIYSYKPMLFYKKAVKVVFCCGAFLFATVTLLFYLLYIYSHPVAVEINELLSDRIERIDIFSQFFSPTLFGQNTTIELDMSLDNMYAFLYFRFGILIMLAFFILLFCLIKKLYNIKDIPLAIVCFIFCFLGLSEHMWIYADYNVFMLSFAFLIYTPQDNIFCDQISNETQAHI